MQKPIIIIVALLLLTTALTGCFGQNDTYLIFDPDERLRKVSQTVDTITTADRETIRKMKHEVEKNNAAGIAASQIGVNRRIIVVNDNGKIFTMINPKITVGEGGVNGIEGCMSIPGVYAIVNRHQKIEVNFMTEKGKQKTETYTGYTARIIQHEVDHLNGVLFYDKAIHVFNDLSR